MPANQTTQCVATTVYLSQFYVVNWQLMITKFRKSHFRTIDSLWTTFTTCRNEPIPGPFTSQKKCNAEVSCAWNSTSTFPIHFHCGVLGKETLWLCVLQLTIKTNYDLRPEHQPALHRDGAWAGESGPLSSVTQSRYSGSDWRLHVSGAVYKVREGQENQGRKKDGMNAHAQMRHISAIDISLLRLTGKLQSVIRLGCLHTAVICGKNCPFGRQKGMWGNGKEVYSQ